MTKRSEQSCFFFYFLYIFLQAKLARNYKILPFEFSKIVKVSLIKLIFNLVSIEISAG